jgi:hypothetical protein
MVLHSAHTAARFAKVAPEVQFLVSIFLKDLKRLKHDGTSTFGEQWTLMKISMQTLSGLYKLHNIHPLVIFLSPMAQIPIFWYFSVDLRKIINGADPALAQQLTESAFLWVTDLTEPDPWYGLPILAGILLYLNVEVAVGSKSLSGEATSKSNIAIYLKDFFQSKCCAANLFCMFCCCCCCCCSILLSLSFSLSPTFFFHCFSLSLYIKSDCGIHAMFHVSTTSWYASLLVY